MTVEIRLSELCEREVGRRQRREDDEEQPGQRPEAEHVGERRVRKHEPDDDDGARRREQRPARPAMEEGDAARADHEHDHVWVTETALATALNTSYMAEQLSIFGIVVGIALLLSGIGFAVLTIGGALRRQPQPEAPTRAPAEPR
jgi:hypothetical protein